jgi:hypothetical protein
VGQITRYVKFDKATHTDHTQQVSRAIYEYLEEIVLRLYMGLDLELSCIIG